MTTITELKTYCLNNNITITGDKRLKATYEQAVKQHDNNQTYNNCLMVLPLMLVAVFIIAVSKLTLIALSYLLFALIWLFDNSDDFYLQLVDWVAYLFGDEFDNEFYDQTKDLMLIE